MATIKVEKTNVRGVREEVVKYVKERRFFGLITWWRKVSAEKISNDLVILTDDKFDNIFLNGKELVIK